MRICGVLVGVVMDNHEGCTSDDEGVVVVLVLDDQAPESLRTILFLVNT
jgi:hypothetical protein